MTNLEIVDSGYAQLTKLEKLLYRQQMGLADYADEEIERAAASSNEDRYAFNRTLGYFAVADGVGGAPHGAKAALAACRAFDREMQKGSAQLITSEEELRIAQTSLARSIHLAARQTAGYTTFTGIYRIGDGHLAYLNAGDSGLSLIRNGRVHSLTTAQNQQGNVLTNRMGGQPDDEMTPLTDQRNNLASRQTEWGVVEVQPGDRYLLGTDGVICSAPGHDVTDSWWLEHADTTIPAQQVADSAVRASPRLDDSTMIVVDFGSTEAVVE